MPRTRAAAAVSSNPRKRPVVVRAVVLVLINLLVLAGLVLVLELGARLWFPREISVVFDNPEAFQRGRPYVQDDARLGFILRAGYSTPRMTISRMGFRAHAPEAQDVALRPERIVCMGGSTTFGWGLADHESYPAQLQVSLDIAWPDRWSVINAGVPSYTSEQLCLVLPTLLDLEPSIVVVQTLWNDLLFSFVNNWFPDLLVHQSPRPWRRSLLRHSAVYRALFLKPVDPARKVVSSLKALRHYRRNLEKIIAACRDRHTEVVFSMPPLQEAMVPETGMRIGSDVAPRELFLQTAAAFTEVMQDVARQHGVPIVSHPVAINAHPAESLFLDPAHPSAEGYRLLAEGVSQVIGEIQRTAVK